MLHEARLLPQIIISATNGLRKSAEHGFQLLSLNVALFFKVAPTLHVRIFKLLYNNLPIIEIVYFKFGNLFLLVRCLHEKCCLFHSRCLLFCRDLLTSLFVKLATY